MIFKIRFKGGPGSGHHGHQGRPGKHGGSTPGSGGSTNATRDPNWGKTIGSAAPIDYSKTNNNVDVELLRKGPVKFINSGSLVASTSPVRLGRLEDGTLVVHKKQSSITQNKGASALGEEAAYEVATKYLGYDNLVPTTVALDNTTSIQQFIEDAVTASDGDIDMLDEQSFKQLVILDMVTGNQDRHLGNILVMWDGAVKAIDNDHAFIAKSVAPGMDPNSIAGMLYRGTQLFEQIQGYSIDITRDDYAPVARKLLGNGNFRDYVNGKFGTDVWNATETRLLDMLED